RRHPDVLQSSRRCACGRLRNNKRSHISRRRRSRAVKKRLLLSKVIGLCQTHTHLSWGSSRTSLPPRHWIRIEMHSTNSRDLRARVAEVRLALGDCDAKVCLERDSVPPSARVGEGG